VVSTKPKEIERALEFFDAQLRHTAEWKNWENNKAHRYAIEANGQLYPAKKIRSLITGEPVSQFIGGNPTNKYLTSLGLTITSLLREEDSSFRPPLQFEIGRTYDRSTEIHDPFGGSRQSGIAPSSQVPAVFLFTGESGEQYGYQDGDDDQGVFSYTGHGQVGDMTLTGGNRAILEHAEQGKSLHLFKSLGKSKGYLYVGEFACADYVWKQGPDRTGTIRDIIVFKLVPVDRLNETEIKTDSITVETKPISLDEARQKALAAVKTDPQSSGTSSVRKLYQRSTEVKAYVFMRAAGKCESCHADAPFLRKDGTPYLEPHHINRLSDGGLDHPRYVGAICPACHREIHYGLNGSAKNEALREYVESLERR